MCRGGGGGVVCANIVLPTDLNPASCMGALDSNPLVMSAR